MRIKVIKIKNNYTDLKSYLGLRWATPIYKTLYATYETSDFQSRRNLLNQ
jgi:hypothetical protein